MRDEKLFRLLVVRMQEVATVPPQTIGPFTYFYKRLVPGLKIHPWKVTALVSFMFTVFLYLVFGIKLVRLVSLLQFGF